MTQSAHRVASFSSLRSDSGTRVDLDGTPILLVRTGDEIHAVSATCPHAGAPLEEGAVCNGHIVCPWHKATFDAATGDVLAPPALLPLDRYFVEVRDDEVFVSPDKIATPPREFASSDAEDVQHFVVIGAGAAGAAACAALRESSFAGRITLIGDEPHVPYDRTSLSKFVASGEMKPADVPPLLPPDWVTSARIERIESAVTRLDAVTRTAHLANGQSIRYDNALVATGSVPVLPKLPGCDLPNVYALRTLSDAERLDKAVSHETRAVVIGSSFIGLEVASAWRKRGVPVAVVSPERVPFARQFGERVGTMIRQMHEANGVAFYLEREVESIAGETVAHSVVLKDGEHVPADIVLLGTGVRPATDFIEGVRLAPDGGLYVNAGMQAAPGLYAAGDIAVFPLHENVEPLRIEHWRVAQQHARVAAENMCGARHRFTGVPYFWTYHYGKNFEYLGHATQWDELVIDGDLEQQQFVALYVHEGTVVAALACERQAATARLIESMHDGITANEALRVVRSDQ